MLPDPVALRVIEAAFIVAATLVGLHLLYSWVGNLILDQAEPSDDHTPFRPAISRPCRAHRRLRDGHVGSRLRRGHVGATVRVVIADEHPITRQGITWMLEGEDEIDIVGEAQDGDSLIALVRATPVDAVLLNVPKRGVDGLCALRRISAEMPHIRVIVLSAHLEPSYVRCAIELGAAGYLLKRTGREDLTRALKAVSEGNAYVQGEVVTPLVASLAHPTTRTCR